LNLGTLSHWMRLGYVNAHHESDVDGGALYTFKLQELLDTLDRLRPSNDPMAEVWGDARR
jgi:hypothetical protein